MPSAHSVKLRPLEREDLRYMYINSTITPV